MFYFNLLIAIVFTGWNAVNAYRSFQAKRWGWFALSAVFALLCGLPLLGLAASLL